MRVEFTAFFFEIACCLFTLGLLAAAGNVEAEIGREVRRRLTD